MHVRPNVIDGVRVYKVLGHLKREEKKERIPFISLLTMAPARAHIYIYIYLTLSVCFSSRGSKGRNK
jgi:hypothetical protein